MMFPTSQFHYQCTPSNYKAILDYIRDDPRNPDPWITEQYNRIRRQDATKNAHANALCNITSISPVLADCVALGLLPLRTALSLAEKPKNGFKVCGMVPESSLTIFGKTVQLLDLIGEYLIFLAQNGKDTYFGGKSAFLWNSCVKESLLFKDLIGGKNVQVPPSLFILHLKNTFVDPFLAQFNAMQRTLAV